jgi:hypothetical protein
MPLMLVTSNRPTITCFGSQLLEIKFTITTMMSCVPFDIQSNVQVVDKQLANAGYT